LKASSKYLVAVALLAVLAVVFGLAGTVAPLSQPTIPQQESSSDSVTHFTYPPTYDSGWVNITGKRGQYFTLNHGLNTTQVFVDITGKQSLNVATGELGWTRAYGGANIDSAWSVVQTGDGGYALTGYTDSYGAGSYDFWLVKADSSGVVQWNQTYGGTDYDEAWSVVATVDGGYAIAGDTWSFGAGGFDFWLVKTDASGNMEWNQTYGGTGWDIAHSLVETIDGGYALVGSTNSFGAGSSDFWLVKTDVDGNMVWNQTYGGTNGDAAYSVVETVDGGYAIAGETRSFGVGNGDFWLVKTDVDGNMVWNQTYGGTSMDWGSSVVETGDGGYALTGRTSSFGAGGFDSWLVKTDSAGNVQWNQTYGGASDDHAWSVVQTVDGGYALAGSTMSYGAGGSDFWLVKVNAEMNLEHQINLGDLMYGLARTGLTNYTIILHRAEPDFYWNYVRVRIWTIQEPTWQFGDINQDGVVDAQDLLILSQNYGKTFSLLSLSGIVAVAGIHTYKKRKQPK